MSDETNKQKEPEFKAGEKVWEMQDGLVLMNEERFMKLFERANLGDMYNNSLEDLRIRIYKRKSEIEELQKTVKKQQEEINSLKSAVSIVTEWHAPKKEKKTGKYNCMACGQPADDLVCKECDEKQKLRDKK
jgi:hypothetical protein